MNGRLSEKPSLILIPLLGAAFLFAAVGLGLAWTAVARTSGDAAEVNRAGIVRGSVQRATKLELAGIPSLDALDVAMSLLQDLHDATGTRLESQYQALARALARLRSAMVDARGGKAEAGDALVRTSEDAWDLSNELVYATESSVMAKRRLFLWGLGFMAGGVLFAGLSVFVSKFLVADRVEMEAAYDTMTGGLRKNRFMQRLGHAMESVGRDESIGVVMFDLDRFKRINDSYGHEAGDRVLAAVGGALRSLLRPGDAFGRMGGEEFAVALRSKDPRAARLFAERARAAVESLSLERLPTMTISAGAVVARHGERPAEALKRADSHLYAAKAAGRNRVRGD